MLRKDLKRATEKILHALRESKIGPVLESVVSARDSKPDRGAVLPAFASYVRFYDDFRAPERQLISILELDILHEPDFWTSLMTTEDFRTSEFYEPLQSVRFAQKHLPKVVFLMARESDEISDPKKKGEQPIENRLAVCRTLSALFR